MHQTELNWLQPTLDKKGGNFRAQLVKFIFKAFRHHACTTRVDCPMSGTRGGEQIETVQKGATVPPDIGGHPHCPKERGLPDDCPRKRDLNFFATPMGHV